MSLILKQFEKNIVEGKFSRDTAQEEAVESLSLLQDRVTLKHNRKINIIGFYDDSKALIGAEINSIKIYGKKKHLKELSTIYPDLEVYLAIPSRNVSQRRAIISSLEKYKVAVRTIPSLHEIVANQKKDG